MEVRKLTQGVYTIMSEIGDPRGDSNFGLITGANGSVLIDMDIRRWEEAWPLIESVAEQPVRYLINTHDNFDHASANTLLAQKGAIIISSEACRSILTAKGAREFRERIAQDDTLRQKYGLSSLSMPDITTDGRLYLNLGERTLELYSAGHAHTPGDLVVYLPKEEILFTGDILFNGCHPVTQNADTANWIKVLAELSNMPLQLTVPGHGEIADGKSNLETLQSYFQIFHFRIRELILQGLSLEEVEKQFKLPEYENWGKKNWLPVNIKKIYQELT